MSASKRQRQKWGLRFRVLERDGFKCVYCGTPASETPLVVDHVRPLAKDGEDHPRNYATSCRPCNGGKGDRLLEITA